MAGPGEYFISKYGSAPPPRTPYPVHIHTSRLVQSPPPSAHLSKLRQWVMCLKELRETGSFSLWPETQI